MAGFTGSWKICRDMIRICCCIVLVDVTAKAYFRGGGIIPLMAFGAIVGNGNMGPGYHIIIIVDRECGRFPSRVRCMAGFTFSRYIGLGVIRIY